MEEVRRRERRLLLAAAAAFTVLFFFELPGSSLLEPDEARYAEIPREMLESGNWLVPRLNFVDYFEKPPFAYWVNAISLKALGHNAFAARLPNRLATIGVVVLLFFGLRRHFGGRVALLAGLLTLSSPLVFGLGRTNLTDGILTFWMTLALVSLHQFLREREEGRPGRLAAIGAGLGCGLAVLTKGLIGVVLSGGALLVWCFLCRCPRRIAEILFSWATPVFLLATVPYFAAVERAAPGFSRFFWIHEHFARYATPEASRPGPAYSFLLLFLAGFLPWSFFLGRLGRRFFASREATLFPRASDLWFGLYAGVILVFFSVSHSKLPPYILPMFPAAAVLIARVLGEPDLPVSRPLLGHAVFWTAAAPAGLLFGLRQGDLGRYGLTGAAALAAAALVLFSWLSVLRAKRERLGAVLTVLPGWAVFYAALIFAFPRVAADQSAQRLAEAARDAAGSEGSVVAYRTYLQGFPWTLERRLRIYGWKGELAFGSGRGDQSAWFRPAEDFWRDWESGQKMVVLMRRRDLPEMEKHRADLVAENRKYIVAKNF